MPGRKVAVIFDFDKTLVCKDSFRLFSLEAAETAMQRAHVLLLAVLCRLGLIDNTSYKERVLARIWRNKKSEDQREFLKHFLGILRRLENRAVVARLKQHVASHHKVIIMSASPEFYLKPFALSWSPDIEVFGTRLHDNGSRIEVDNLFGNLKAVLAEKIIQQLEPSTVIVYTDHISDFSLIMLATDVRLVSPSRECIRALKKSDIRFEIICP